MRLDSANRFSWLVLFGCTALALGGCRQARVLRAKLTTRRAHAASHGGARATRAPLPPRRDAFGSARPEGALRSLRSLGGATMYGPFFAATDGALAVLSPAGRLRWVSLDARANAPRVREVDGPCRFDASRHSSRWTLASRVALDGRGHACCVHDGDERAHAGAWCADLDDEAPRFRRVRTLVTADGVGSGEGAIAIFASSVWCTSDGGRTLGREFRGDAEQVTTAASCADDGTAVMVAGTRSLGAQREQSLRVARAGGAMVLAEGAPRGEPVDVHALHGAVAALLVTFQGYSFVGGIAGETMTPRAVRYTGAARIGPWGERAVLLGGSGHAELFGLRQGAPEVRVRDATSGGPGREVELAVLGRVGESLVGIDRSGAVMVLEAD